MRRGDRFLLALSLAVFAASASAQTGTFVFVAGEAQIAAPSGDNKERLAQRGGEIREGETLTVGKGAVAQIRLPAGGFLMVRSETRVRIDRFGDAAAPPGAQQPSIFLQQGNIRITVAAGRTEKSTQIISTPVLTLTTHAEDQEISVIPSAASEPGASTAGVYVKAVRGVVLIEAPRGNFQLNPGLVAHLVDARSAPAIVAKAPETGKPAAIATGSGAGAGLALPIRTEAAMDKNLQNPAAATSLSATGSMGSQGFSTIGPVSTQKFEIIVPKTSLVIQPPAEIQTVPGKSVPIPITGR